MIIGLHKGDHEASDISRILGIPRSTCQNVIKKYDEKGLADTLPRSGRPALLTRDGKTQQVSGSSRFRNRLLAHGSVRFRTT